MSTQVELIPGPLTSEVTRTAAESSLRRHAAIQQGAAYALEQIDGRWVAAIVAKTAADAPPFGGAPADTDEEAPGPKSEGPDDAEPSEAPKLPGDGDADDAGPPTDGDGPPKKDKGGEKGELHQVVEMLHQIAEALGLPIGLGESPVPGPDGPDVPTPPPAGPPHGLGGPSGGPPAVQKVVHDRVTKPGETPPGGTPIGAPSFASVRSDHPWAHLAGKVASFPVASEIGKDSLPEINTELTALASEIGYRVSRLRETHDSEGNRVAEAVITAH